MHLAHLDIKPGNIFISRETRYDSADDGFEDDENPDRDDVTYKIGKFMAFFYLLSFFTLTSFFSNIAENPVCLF